jgi:hypothetical protein
MLILSFIFFFLKHVRWYDYLYLVVCQAISYSAISSKYIHFIIFIIKRLLVQFFQFAMMH